jgi:hypothetical protein
VQKDQEAKDSPNEEIPGVLNLAPIKGINIFYVFAIAFA